MRMVCVALLAGCLAGNVSAGTIGTSIVSNGGNSYTESFTIQGFSFTMGQELDIYFDASLYGVLSNGVPASSSDWNLLLLQPNNPPGTAGDYSLLALVDNPSLAGPFSVDFTYTGSGQPGGVQPFTVFNSNFTVNTTGTTGVPEPSSLSTAGIGALMLGALWFVRRRTGADGQNA